MLKSLFTLTTTPILLIGMVGCATQDFQDYPEPITQINSGFYSNVPGNTSVTIIENRPIVVPNNNYPYYDDPYPYYNPNNSNYNQATPNARAPTPLRPGSNYRTPNYYRNQNNNSKNNSTN